ncbi:MAG TPA: biopolymer transporter ExbD [Sumerlaeia bacterium]|nr:biopolymer transporter ExbD [Sumerlaeia bacterium]
MQSRWRTREGAEISLAPLLDVIFCLLFFFVVATSLRQEREVLKVSLPRTSQGTRQAEESPPLTVTITRENKILLHEKEITGAALSAELKEYCKENPAQGSRVLIQADGEANVQTLLEVSDACSEAGIKKAVMPTRPKTPEEEGD